MSHHIHFHHWNCWIICKKSTTIWAFIRLFFFMNRGNMVCQGSITVKMSSTIFAVSPWSFLSSFGGPSFDPEKYTYYYIDGYQYLFLKTSFQLTNIIFKSWQNFTEFWWEIRSKNHIEIMNLKPTQLILNFNYWSLQADMFRLKNTAD